MQLWRNGRTRKLEMLVEKSVEVRVLSAAPSFPEQLGYKLRVQALVG